MSTPCLTRDELERLHAGELPAERAAAVEGHLRGCAACQRLDAELREEHEAMLADLRPTAAAQPSDAAAPDSGGTPDDSTAATVAEPAARPGLSIPGYEVVREIHRGGQGIVYQAIQTSTRRKVAVKLLLEGAGASPAARRRFEREIELVAQLRHPNIIAIFDSGRTADGRQFAVMDYIRGQPFTTYVRERKLSLGDALALFAKVCAAVQYAHQRGVIHRDLKPSNVLVDADGEPKVLDFGLARQLVAPTETVLTLTEQGIGTLPYMSPEQTRGNPDEVDTRTDIYALGVMLYETLTGQYPYPVAGQMADVLRHIAETEPKPPSQVWLRDPGLARTASGAQRRELAWIPLKALRKDRHQRYRSAAELADDLQNFVEGRPLIAGPESAGYRLRKFVRRYRGLVVASSLVLLALLIGLGGTTWGVFWALGEQARADAERAAALKASDETKRVADFHEQMLAQVDPTAAGVRLTEDVNRRFAAALEKLGVPEEERKQQADAFRQQWLRVNATDAAQALIDETILRPAVKAIDEKFKDQPLVAGQLQQVLASRYHELGLYDRAVSLQKSAIDTRRRALGDEHPDTLQSLSKLGWLLVEQDKLAEAEPYFREALEKRRRVLGEEHPDTLISIDNLGSLLWSRKKPAEAESHFREALATRRRVLGEEHPDTLRSVAEVGWALHRQDKLAEAEPCLREVLEKRRRVLGEEHPDTLESLSEMGKLLQDQGQLAEAEPYLREALEKRRRVLGEGDLATRISKRSLDSLERRLERVRGQEHGNTSDVLTEAVESAEWLQRQFKTTRRERGEEHPETLGLIPTFGMTLIVRGKHEDAVALLAAAESPTRKLFSGDNTDPLGPLLTVLGIARARMPYDAERFVAAEANLTEAHAIFTQASDWQPHLLLLCRRGFVALYDAWHVAEPERGYDVKAAEWRAKLEALYPSTQPSSNE